MCSDSPARVTSLTGAAVATPSGSELKARGSLTGCGTALVTPFAENGELDERALRAFVDWQIKDGVHFVVPCGSTGEAATMSLEEHRRVV